MRLTLFVMVTALLVTPARADDTTPYNCERLTFARTASWAAPVIRDFCETQEARSGQAVARILGKPRPSTAVYALPAYGSDDATRAGLACISGTAMQRLPKGWEQLRDRNNHWLRCRDR